MQHFETIGSGVSDPKIRNFVSPVALFFYKKIMHENNKEIMNSFWSHFVNISGEKIVYLHCMFYFYTCCMYVLFVFKVLYLTCLCVCTVRFVCNAANWHNK